MKIAIQISGHTKDWKLPYKYFKKHFLDHWNLDVFISTWDVDGWNYENGHGDRFGLYMFKDDMKESSMNRIDEEELKTLYNPKRIEVEKHDSVYFPTLRPYNLKIGHKLEQLTLMWYKMHRANVLMREYSTDYDVVLRWRFDQCSLKPLEFEIPKPNVLYGKWSCEGLQDRYFYGNVDTINYMTSGIFEWLTNTPPEELCKNVISSEHVSSYCMHSKGITLNEIKNFDTLLSRGLGNKMSKEDFKYITIEEDEF